MRYGQTRYRYNCLECKSTDFEEIIEDIEEVCFPELYDDNGNEHYHDLNMGNTFLLCKNGHKTRMPYIAACECGWNFVTLDNSSCETFYIENFVPTIIDSDSD